MNFTLNQLRVYLKVTQTLSITKAAEELHLSQPAVSIQLKNFQNQFDIPLIEIINKKIFVTDFGKEIAVAADNLLAEAYAINFKFHTHKGQLAGKLKISVVSTGSYVAPFFIAEFIKDNQAIELLLDVTNKAQVIHSLEKNEVDFALVSVLPDHIDVDKLELMENKLYVVGNTDESFGSEEYSKKIFDNISLIYREQGSGTRYVMESFIRKNNLPVKKKMELTGNEAVKQALIAGLGYSIMPLIGMKNELENGQLQIVKVKGFPIKSTWYLIWLKGKKLSPVADAYLNYIKKEKHNIIRDKFDWLEKYKANL